MGVPRKEGKFTKKTMISSSRSHREKRIRKPDRKPKTMTPESLPKDLLVDVLARVASSSFTDLFNAKLWDYLEAAEDEYIFQHVSIEKFPIVDWVPPPVETLLFLTHCFRKGNPQAFFRRGMIEYFSLMRVESGLEYLKKATEKSLPEATYAFGMLLLSRGDKSGVNLLNSRSRDWNIQDCRDKIKSVLSQIWVNNKIPPQQNFFNCHPVEIGGFDQRVFGCDSCMWYRELRVFSKIVNGA